MKVTAGTKPGTKVKVIANGANHQIALGTTLTLKHTNFTNHNPTITVNESAAYLLVGDVELVCVTSDGIKSDIKELEEQIDLLKLKLSYMEEVGSKNFDENEFKAYSTLKTLDDKKMSTFARENMAKSFYIKERHNPQFEKPYYVPQGQLTKAQAARIENALYGTNVMLEYKTVEEYEKARVKFKKDGFSVHAETLTT